MPNFENDLDDSGFDNDLRGNMPNKTIKIVRKHDKRKPKLIVVGESMVDPNDVSAIKKIRSKTDLYVIILKSQPNMEFPFWASGEEVAKLLEHFNIVD